MSPENPTAFSLLGYDAEGKNTFAAYAPTYETAADLITADPSKTTTCHVVREESTGKETVISGKRLIGTVDCAPTWASILPVLMAALEYGTPAGKSMARTELERMAKLADAYVKEHR
ncbi:hypothetical protein UFOVP1324_39 [uncultured Caudovirales phage]|uniref:Uncharacterized protein n=1 Tax=uncultured Caudovirales phage TaxID=2100421 RepID=A0A6J5RRX4_9CAUD|nr:hypothetical protein UFOVP1324_39 [uncultured Caudovirales phage]